GREIYVGDIIKTTCKHRPKYVVKTLHEFFEDRGYDEYFRENVEYEVIGNIYEAKENLGLDGI
ncbi:unnamed protein product, partial [marine sediment metagenome]